MEIKVNDYVRTKAFGIKKVKYFEGEEAILENGFTALQSDGYESSPRIKDLIQVGDYVNGWRVTQITNSYVEICWGRDSDEFIKPENIKSVLTKEQFEQMEYKIN